MASSGKKVLLVGASGLVGSQALSLLLKDPQVAEVRVLGRRALSSKHLKLKEKIIDFNDLFEAPGSFADFLEVDSVISCLGSTRAQSRSDDQFRWLEVEVVRKLARLALMKGASQFLLVSSVGADPHSPFLYFKLKGEIEVEIMSLPFSSIRIYRPSFLLGRREESRLLESLTAAFVGWTARVWPPRLRPISSDRLAERMLHDLHGKDLGKQIIQSEALLEF